jgi:hypothetical protein
MQGLRVLRNEAVLFSYAAVTKDEYNAADGLLAKSYAATRNVP